MDFVFTNKKERRAYKRLLNRTCRYCLKLSNENYRFIFRTGFDKETIEALEKQADIFADEGAEKIYSFIDFFIKLRTPNE